jgi:hypothetical protein
MKKWKDQWKELLPYEKRFEVAMWVLVCAFVVFFALDILREIGVLDIGFDAFPIGRALIIAANVCEAVVCWRTNRNLAHTAIITAVIFGLGAIRDIVRLFL